MSRQKQAVYEFDNFRLDAGRRRLLRDGEPVQLPSKAFDLLLALVENNGRLVEKEELYQMVWADQIVEESNLTVQMSAIRKALGERRENPRYIVTIPGRGYRFIGDVASLDEDQEVVIETETLARIVIEREEVDDNNVHQYADPLLADDNGLKPVKAQSTFTPQAETTSLSQKQGFADGENTAAGISTVKALPEASAKRFWQRGGFFYLTGGLILALLAAGGFIIWRYYWQPKNQVRPTATDSAAIPFAQMKIKQLTTKGKVSWAALSPDGKFYAYALDERGEYKRSLWLGQTDGSRDIQLRPADDNLVRGAAFSPDSRTLYFALRGTENEQGGLFKLPVLGGVAEKLLDNVDDWFSLSPDGKQIAFFGKSIEKGAHALVIANLDGTGERELLVRPRDADFSSSGPAWSPDGSSLAFAAVADSAKQSEEIFISRVADGQAEQLTALEWRRIHDLVWLRDGQGLIAVATDKSETLRHLWHIDLYGNPRRLSQDTDSYGSALSISADGEQLLAVQIKRESNLWVAPSDDFSEARQITFSSINGIYGWYGFDWTPDDRIVFVAGIDRTLALHSMDADSGQMRQLTSKGFSDQRPTVTSDGRYIVFQSNRSGATEIWRAGVDGSDLKQLTTGGGNSYPHSTPDGKGVVYISDRGGKSFIWRVPIEGGESVQVTDRRSSIPRVSPDGKLIACGYKAKGQSSAQLALVSIEDGKLVKLFDTPRSGKFADGIRFTPDGKAICYRDKANGFWRQEISGGPPQRLKGLPEEKIYTYGWSRDGKLFAFTRGREISDAVLITDFR